MHFDLGKVKIIPEISVYKNRTATSFLEYNNNISFNIFLKRYFLSKKNLSLKMETCTNLPVIVLRLLGLKYQNF